MRDVERALRRVEDYNVYRIRRDDILNQISVWERVRGVADRAKVEMEERIEVRYFDCTSSAQWGGCIDKNWVV